MNHYESNGNQASFGSAAAIVQAPDKSALDKVIKASAANNEMQSNVQSRIRTLLSQLRGDRPVACGSGNVRDESCALAVIEGAAETHANLNTELNDMVEELEQLLSY
ncbi:hypothetical protein ACINJI_002782 [Cronobacter dublinensis]